MTASVNDPFTPQPLRARPAARLAELARTVVALFKLRIVVLLLLTGVGGACLAAGGWPGLGPLALMTLTGGLSAAGASALNQYLEQSQDAAMHRTRQRPLVNGAVTRAGWVPVLAIALIVVPALLVWPSHSALTFWSVAGAVIYVGVYTVWLKPRTVLNIVIGGWAGTCAVLSGGAAVGQWAHPAVLALGLLVFLWTPAHFWSLAMMCREDYARANVPMLPVRASMEKSARWVALHVAATSLAALALAAQPGLGWVYALPVALATVDLLRRTARLLREPTTLRARALFLASNTYLAIVVVMICVAFWL